MREELKKWQLKKGDAISFLNQTVELRGEFVRHMDPYLLVNTPTELWRVLPHNVVIIRGKRIKTTHDG
jgi:hypothetical protein